MPVAEQPQPPGERETGAVPVHLPATAPPRGPCHLGVHLGGRERVRDGRAQTRGMLGAYPLKAPFVSRCRGVQQGWGMVSVLCLHSPRERLSFPDARGKCCINRDAESQMFRVLARTNHP